MLIITMLGYPVAALPILTIIATIIDAPATMLNVTGDTASSMMVARIVDGKEWLENTASKDRKIEKEDSAKYAFLLFVPAMIGATVLEVTNLTSLFSDSSKIYLN